MSIRDDVYDATDEVTCPGMKNATALAFRYYYPITPLMRPLNYKVMAFYPNIKAMVLYSSRKIIEIYIFLKQLFNKKRFS